MKLLLKTFDPIPPVSIRIGDDVNYFHDKAKKLYLLGHFSYDNWVATCIPLKLIMIPTCIGSMLFDVKKKKAFLVWCIEVWYIKRYVNCVVTLL